MRAVVGWQSSALFLCLVCFHGEVEIGGGVGLVAEREMPPFTLHGCESVPNHNVAQQQPILLLRRCDLVADWAGDAAEEVENAAHINLFARFDVHQGHVNGGAARVSGLAGYISA